MAEIIQEPQLRYTADNQTAITEMVVQFDSTRADDPPATLKAIAWGNRAEDIYNQYKVGDRLVFEGRLSMISVDRPEGFKEKRAELVISRAHALAASGAATPQYPSGQTVVTQVSPSQNVVSLESRRPPGTALPDRTAEFTPPPATQPSADVSISSGISNNYPPEIPSSPPSNTSENPENYDSPSQPDEIPF